MTTTWIMQPADGTYAWVDGPTRDRLIPFGWRDAAEPVNAEDFVWVRHEGIDGAARLPFQSLPFWRANGWVPGAPNEHVDPTKEPVVPEPAPEAKSTATGKAASDKNPKE